MEGVTQQHGLYLLIEWTRTRKRWQHVDLKQPWFQIGVDKHIKAIDLEAGVFAFGRPVLCYDVWLDGHERLDADVLDLDVYFAVVNTHTLVLVLQHFQAPLRFHLLFFIPIVVILLLWLLTCGSWGTCLFDNCGRIGLLIL